jgi:hypothetical protein
MCCSAARIVSIRRDIASSSASFLAASSDHRAPAGVSPVDALAAAPPLRLDQAALFVVADRGRAHADAPRHFADAEHSVAHGGDLRTAA